MKTVTWLLLFALLAIEIFCNDGILAKFHQNGYKIKDFRVELIDYNKKYYHFFEIKTFKYNRTTAAVNATQIFKISVKDKLEVSVQVRKFLSNEYRHFPIELQANLKKSVDAKIGGLQEVKNCGNFTNFIFEKDVIYHMCNFVVDETHLPPLIPNGRFRIDANVTYLNDFGSLVYIFMEVYIPFPYPKK